MKRPAFVFVLAMIVGACGASLTGPHEAASASASLTLRSTDADERVYAELDADGTLHLGPCRIGVLRGRRFESVAGDTMDLSGDHAHLADGRTLQWSGDHVVQRTPSGDLDVWVTAAGAVFATNSAAGGGPSPRSSMRFDALPPGASERALMVAVIVYDLGRGPCDSDSSGVPDDL